MREGGGREGDGCTEEYIYRTPISRSVALKKPSKSIKYDFRRPISSPGSSKSKNHDQSSGRALTKQWIILISRLKTRREWFVENHWCSIHIFYAQFCGWMIDSGGINQITGLSWWIAYITKYWNIQQYILHAAQIWNIILYKSYQHKVNLST